jgi:hypothetical protein
MQETQTILIVLLSVGFLFLLIMSCIAVFLIIKILSNIRRVTERVDETSQNMGEMLKYIGRKVGPGMITTIGSVLWRSVKQGAKRRK